MKKNIKNILIIAILTFSLLSSTCFVNAGDESTSASGVISNIGSRILSVVLWVGYAIAFGMVVFIGIKYITGSADAKANMKSAIISWLIGAFLVFACTTIVSFVLNTAGISDGGDLASEIINAAK